MSPEQQAHFRILKTLEEHPEYTQRQLADAVGLSLGRTNYMLRALVEKGLVKLGKFMGSDRKLVKAAYLLTPAGVRQRMAMTQDYVRSKRREYEALAAELTKLQDEVPEALQGKND